MKMFNKKKKVEEAQPITRVAKIGFEEIFRDTNEKLLKIDQEINEQIEALKVELLDKAKADKEVLNKILESISDVYEEPAKEPEVDDVHKEIAAEVAAFRA